jgi:hypothetical protein
MSETEEKGKGSPELEAIRETERLLRSGRAEGVLSAFSATVEGRVQILKLAEHLDAQTLKLTVTI